MSTKMLLTNLEDETGTPVSTLHVRLMAAQRSLMFIVKDASNDFAKYKYPKADTYIAKCREALLANDLLLKRSFSFDREDSTVAITFELFAPDVGEADIDTVVFPVTVRSGMPEDKATSAAVTTGTAYFLQGLFMLPRVDSIPEIDDIDDTKFTPKPSKKATTTHGAKAKKAALQKAINDLAAFSGVDPATCFEMAAQRAAQNDTSLTPEFVSGLLESAKTKKERAQ